MGIFLIYGSQAVLGLDSIIFSSITQCGPFNISFAGGQAPALPLTITVVRFNSTNPVYITVPRDAWNTETSSGTAVTFLPFAAGTEFVASLDDVNGRGYGKVSDVIKIQPSDDSRCLFAGDNTTNSTRPYTLLGSMSQCEAFTLSFNPESENTPTVRVFRPKGSSFFINSTNESPGTTTFVTEIQRGKEIVMLFDDGRGNQQTTELITVDGDSSSSVDCIKQSSKLEDDKSGQLALPKYVPKPFIPHILASNSSHKFRSAIFDIVAASSSIVGGTALLMGLYAYRRKRFKVTRETRPKVVLPMVQRPALRTPRYVSGITLFGTLGVVTPPPSGDFDYRGIRANGRSSWARPERPTSFSDLESSSGGIYHGQSPRSILKWHSIEPQNFDLDLIPDMATICSHSSIYNHPNTRATPDVPVAAERFSTFYPCSAESEYIHSQSSLCTISTVESGQRIIIEPFVTDVREVDARPESQNRYWMGR